MVITAKVTAMNMCRTQAHELKGRNAATTGSQAEKPVFAGKAR